MSNTGVRRETWVVLGRRREGLRKDYNPDVDMRKVPYQRTIVVCCNVRGDGRKACANPSRGEDRGDVILDALKAEAKRLGLKGKIRVARSGCLDLCEKGPNIFVFPDGAWLAGVTLADVPRLVETYLTPAR